MIRVVMDRDLMRFFKKGICRDEVVMVEVWFYVILMLSWWKVMWFFLLCCINNGNVGMMWKYVLMLIENFYYEFESLFWKGKMIFNKFLKCFIVEVILVFIFKLNCFEFLVN